jgi:hypothetical protein
MVGKKRGANAVKRRNVGEKKKVNKGRLDWLLRQRQKTLATETKRLDNSKCYEAEEEGGYLKPGGEALDR